jgi:hypothetical protein
VGVLVVRVRALCVARRLLRCASMGRAWCWLCCAMRAACARAVECRALARCGRGGPAAALARVVVLRGAVRVFLWRLCTGAQHVCTCVLCSCAARAGAWICSCVRAWCTCAWRATRAASRRGMVAEPGGWPLQGSPARGWGVRSPKGVGRDGDTPFASNFGKEGRPLLQL